MKKKALIAGALGVIGRSLIQELEKQQDWEIVGISHRVPENKGKTKEQNGTTIRFRPDNEIFEDGLDFNSGELIEILKTKAYLVSGLKITFS